MKRCFLAMSLLMLALSCAGCLAGPQEASVTLSPSPLESSLPVIIQRITPSPTPNPLAAHSGEYTIAWLSDTQHYSKKFPDLYLAMTDYLAKQRWMLNLKYIVHTGDLVHNYDDAAQWELADRAMNTISSVPSGVLAGNHDVGNSRGNYSVFCQYFGAHRYDNAVWYGGSHDDNRCHYDLLTLGTTDYIFVYVGFSPEACCLRFVREAFEAYPERVGVLCAHEYLDTDSSLRPAGETLFQQVVRRCPNVSLVLCGHRYNSDCVPVTLDDDGDGQEDRTVYQIIANYQREGDLGGSGYIRFLRIDEEAGLLRMYSYSPVLDDFNYYDDGSWLEEAVLPLPWLS